MRSGLLQRGFLIEAENLKLNETAKKKNALQRELVVSGFGLARAYQMLRDAHSPNPHLTYPHVHFKAGINIMGLYNPDTWTIACLLGFVITAYANNAIHENLSEFHDMFQKRSVLVKVLHYKKTVVLQVMVYLRKPTRFSTFYPLCFHTNHDKMALIRNVREQILDAINDYNEVYAQFSLKNAELERFKKEYVGETRYRMEEGMKNLSYNGS
ncbi:unnamed protein product [Gongylonema pulchrum]|uniref:Protein kinase domain-containing protein n=1 Tax=Gongylonema pulchrum TaxID=637853 RepID=A0A183CUX4_9BILA|nr:unnamed protein product [Gongylonema pulchrum]